MKKDLKTRYDFLLIWIEGMIKSHNIKKASVLMNDHISGFIASEIASNFLGKNNVVNVVIPCYSSTDYILNSAKFSNELGIKYKNIAVKDVYDDIMEKDIEDGEPNDITEFLRYQIMDAISYKNNSVVMSFQKSSKSENYVFSISKEHKSKEVYSFDGSFSEEELKVIAEWKM